LGDFCALCAKRWMTESVIVEGFEKNCMCNRKFFMDVLFVGLLPYVPYVECTYGYALQSGVLLCLFALLWTFITVLI
jgi:hypothetical protein